MASHSHAELPLLQQSAQDAAATLNMNYAALNEMALALQRGRQKNNQSKANAAEQKRLKKEKAKKAKKKGKKRRKPSSSPSESSGESSSSSSSSSSSEEDSSDEEEDERRKQRKKKKQRKKQRAPSTSSSSSSSGEEEEDEETARAKVQKASALKVQKAIAAVTPSLVSSAVAAVENSAPIQAQPTAPPPPQIRASGSGTTSSGTEGEVCKFCPGTVRVPSHDMAEHVHLEHEKAVFFCTLCDDDENDSTAKSVDYAEVADHIRRKHNVTNAEGIQLNVKIPYVEYLRRHRCMLCAMEFIGMTEENLVQSHFKAFHQTKNVKPKQIKRICRICNFDKFISDAVLIQHINEKHPRDAFADDDDDDEETAMEQESSPPPPPPPPRMEIKREPIKREPIKREPIPAPAFVPASVSRAAAPPPPLPPVIKRPPASAAAAAVAAAFRPHQGIDASSLVKVEGLEELLSSINAKPESKKREHSASSSSSSSSSSSDDSSSEEDKKKKKKKKKDKKKRKKEKKKAKKEKKKAKQLESLRAIELAMRKNEEEEVEDNAEKEKFKQMAEHRAMVLTLQQKQKERAKQRAEEAASFKPVNMHINKPSTIPNSMLVPTPAVFNDSLEEGEVSPTRSRETQAVLASGWNAVKKHNRKPPPQHYSPPPPPRNVMHRRSRSGSYGGPGRGRRSRSNSSSSRERSPPHSYHHRKVTLEGPQNRDRSRTRSRSRNRSRSRSRGDFHCYECDSSFTEEQAFGHYQSDDHRYHTRNKVRCFLCSRYVTNAKNHFESVHARDIFQCKLKCHNPKSLDLLKILNHMMNMHGPEIRNKSNEELFRKGFISMPAVLASYKCRVCKRLFVGQSEEKIFQHLRHEDDIRNPSCRDVTYSCRICGPQKYFDNDYELQRHCADHKEYVNGKRSRSRSGSRGRSSARHSHSRSRSRSYSTSRSRSPRSRSGSRAWKDDGQRRANFRSNSGHNSGHHQQHNNQYHQRMPPPTTKHKVKAHYVKCAYCFQVTERHVKDMDKHQRSNHKDYFFNCALCDFSAITMRPVYDHLVTEHGKDPKDQNEVRDKFIKYPGDLRTLFCEICSEDVSSDPTEDPHFWSCQSLQETRTYLEDHLKQKHGGNLTVGNSFRLGCRACRQEFYFNEEDEWRAHLRRDHPQPEKKAPSQPRHSKSLSRAAGGDHSRSRSRSRRHEEYSRSPRDNVDNERSYSSSDDEGGTRRSRPRHSNNSASYCQYCCSYIEGGLLSHMQTLHWSNVFRCRICPETRLQAFHSEPDIETHMYQEHKEDTRFPNWKDFVSKPEDLRCVKCNLCANGGQYFYAVGAGKVRDRHFELAHEDTTFHTGHLEFLCRMCMKTGENDDEEELKEHLYKMHGIKMDSDNEDEAAEDKKKKEEENEKAKKGDDEDEDEVDNEKPPVPLGSETVPAE